MKRLFLSALLIASLVAFVPSAQALQLIFDLDYEFSGAQSPESSTTPWLRAIFDDGDTAGSVTLTMQALNLIEAEHVKVWTFNFDPNLNPDILTLTYSAGVSAISLDTEANDFKADGDGFFDIQFEFANGVFGAGDSSTYSITGAGITAASFDYESVGGEKGSWGSAAHVGSIDICGDDNAGSGWIGGHADGGGGGGNPPVPEPATMLLLGTGLVGFAATRRKKRMK